MRNSIDAGAKLTKISINLTNQENCDLQKISRLRML